MLDARFATLPPYEPYIDVGGKEHRGTNRGEVFREPPTPPAPYQTGAATPRVSAKAFSGGAPPGRRLHWLQHRSSLGLTSVEGFVKGLGGPNEPRWGTPGTPRSSTTTRRSGSRPAADPDWYPPSNLLPGDEVHGLRDPSLLLPARRPLPCRQFPGARNPRRESIRDQGLLGALSFPMQRRC